MVTIHNDFVGKAKSAADKAERGWNDSEGKGLAAVAYALLHLAEVISEGQERGEG